MPPNVNPASAIRVVDRAFAVLEAIGAETDGATIAQIMARTGLPLVTTHRLVRTLQTLGYAEQDLDTGRWHVGLRVLELRGRVSTATKLATLARPFLKDLMLASGGRANLALCRDGEVVYIDIVRDLRSLDTYVPPGHRNPAHCTALGKVFLAELSGDQVARFVEEKGLPPRTERTITRLDALQRELHTVRAAGYAVEIGESAPDSRCFAAPVRDYTERVIAGISVSADRQRFPDERHAELISLVTDAARRLSERLGYQSEQVPGELQAAGTGGRTREF
ncbi:MAG: IclR family transcriptional regulator [Chloroflexi bacterium]|nr:IclR family transcriptional regulator [Chloroflexota bacterium]